MFKKCYENKIKTEITYLLKPLVIIHNNHVGRMESYFKDGGKQTADVLKM